MVQRIKHSSKGGSSSRKSSSKSRKSSSSRSTKQTPRKSKINLRLRLLKKNTKKRNASRKAKKERKYRKINKKWIRQTLSNNFKDENGNPYTADTLREAVLKLRKIFDIGNNAQSHSNMSLEEIKERGLHFTDQFPFTLPEEKLKYRDFQIYLKKNPDLKSRLKNVRPGLFYYEDWITPRLYLIHLRGNNGDAVATEKSINKQRIYDQQLNERY